MKNVNRPTNPLALKDHTGPRDDLAIIDSGDLSDDLMRGACYHVANGGSLTQWCDRNKILYSSMLEAMRDNQNHVTMYGQALMDRDEWLREQLLQLMKEIMMFDTRDCFDNNGHFLPMNEMPEHAAKMIKKSRTVREAQVDGPPDVVDYLEFYDKQKAIDQIGKYLQMFTDRPELNNKPKSLEETIARSYEKYKNGEE